MIMKLRVPWKAYLKHASVSLLSAKEKFNTRHESKGTTIKFRMRTPIIQWCCSASRTGHSTCLTTLRQNRLLHRHKTYKHFLGSTTQYYIFHEFYRIKFWERNLLNPLNAELNPICHLLALLGAHHFLHVSRIRVKSLILRLLMFYIYIWSTYSWCF